VVPLLFGEGQLPFEDESVDLSVSGGHERGPSCEENVEDDSYRPDIALVVVVLPDDLGGNVVDLYSAGDTLPTLREVAEC